MVRVGKENLKIINSMEQKKQNWLFLKSGFNSRNPRMSFTLKVAESIGGANYFIQPPTPNIRNIPAGVTCPVSPWAVRK